MNGQPWQPCEDAALAALYPNTPLPKLVNILGRTERAIYSRAKLLGIKRSQAFLAGEHSGRLRSGDGKETQFAPGHKSWNAGMKGWQAGGRSAETRFKKGNRPHSWNPIGHERITKDGYLQRKTTDTGYTPRDYRMAHHLLWEAHHGPVPPGHALVFKDGNKQHIELDNLELLSRAALCQRNTIHRYSAELKGIIRLQKKLERAIRRHDEKQTKRPA